MSTEPQFLDQLNEPDQPGEGRRVYGLAMLRLGGLGIVISLAGIVIGVAVVGFAAILGMLQTPAGTFNWLILAPLGAALAIGMLSFIIIKIGGKLQRADDRP